MRRVFRIGLPPGTVAAGWATLACRLPARRFPSGKRGEGADPRAGEPESSLPYYGALAPVSQVPSTVGA